MGGSHVASSGEARTSRCAFRVLVTAVSLDFLAIALPAAGAGCAGCRAGRENLEEITVTGIRAAQQRAIDIKRSASQIIDSISAEDIGKLPDGTISDSLQRIPGVQIRREAGEGSAVNVRGLPQVTTQLNGEEYLGANSITNVQPNFGDIPSQLFAGVDVIKTPTANLLNAGTTGTINLKTRRPLDLNTGFYDFAGRRGRVWRWQGRSRASGQWIAGVARRERGCAAVGVVQRCHASQLLQRPAGRLRLDRIAGRERELAH